MQNQAPPSGLDLVRCIATARIVMPRTVVRLSAGRLDLSSAEQALAFMAGANSIFDGDKLLTTPNNDRCATLYARVLVWVEAGGAVVTARMVPTCYCVLALQLRL
jgi:biotin synthase-like enzyme